MIPDKPGIYPNLPFADYHQIRAVNHSTLVGFNRTPAHAREQMLHPKDGTEALATGHAFHTFLLQPEVFAAEYVVPPKINRRFKAGKAAWKEWEAAHPGALLLTQEEGETYHEMREAVLAHPTAKELLSGAGANELTLVWTDPETGLLCKARLDRLTALAGWPFIVDVKTSRNAAERPFQRDIAAYHYHQQGAWYRHGANALKPAERRVALIAVEKEPPFGVAVWEITDRALDQGARECRKHLQEYAHCMETGVWPCYDAGMGLLDLPPWSVDQLDLD